MQVIMRTIIELITRTVARKCCGAASALLRLAIVANFRPHNGCGLPDECISLIAFFVKCEFELKARRNIVSKVL